MLFGGLDTPVSIAIVPIIERERRCRSWIRGPPARRSRKNGAKPNYVFRVSAVDELVDKAMLQYAQKTFSAKKPRHDPRQQPLGRVEREGPDGRAAARRGMKPAGIEKFEGNDVDVVPQLTRLKAAGADVPVPRRQRRPVGAGREVARPHGLEAADRVALGSGGRPLHRARRPEREERALRADLQLLRQTVAGRREGAEGADGQVSGHQGRRATSRPRSASRTLTMR